MKDKTRKQIAHESIGVGILSQVSRNQKINDIGGVVGVAGLIILIGELIKLPLKAIYYSFVYILKMFWLITKYSFIYGLVITKYSYKKVKWLFVKYKERKQLKI